MKKEIDVRLMSIIWITGAFLVSLTYLLLHMNLVFYDIIFWIGILLSGMSTYMVASSGHKTETKLSFLFFFGLILYIPHTLSSPNYFHIYDELIHYQTSTLMGDSGSLNIGSASFIISRYYPSLEILTVFFKNLTGGSVFGIGLIIVGIAHSFTAIALYMFFRNICSEKIASIGTFAYFFNSSYTHFDAYFSYESIGVPLLVICLFAISRYNGFLSVNNNNINNNGLNNDSTIYTFIQIVLITGLVITHHFSSYMLFLFMVILLIIKTLNYANTKNYGKIRVLTFLIGALIITWILYVATIVLTYYNGIITESIEGVVRLSLLEERISELLSAQFLDIPYYELIIRRFIFIPLILIFVSFGIYYIYAKKRFEEYILTLTIFSGLFFISLIGTLTSSFEIGRFSTYGFIGIAFLIGIAIEKMQKIEYLKHFIFVSIILLLIGGISVGISSPFRGSYSDNIRIGQQTITADTISASEWSEKYMGRYNVVTSDIATGSSLEYYGFQNVKMDQAWEIFFPSVVDSEGLYYLKSYNITYIATDKRLSRHISELRYYFKRDELDIKDHPPYGRTETLPIISIIKFDDSDAFLKIYDGGNIGIYRLSKYAM